MMLLTGSLAKSAPSTLAHVRLASTLRPAIQDAERTGKDVDAAHAKIRSLLKAAAEQQKLFDKRSAETEAKIIVLQKMAREKPDTLTEAVKLQKTFSDGFFNELSERLTITREAAGRRAAAALLAAIMAVIASQTEWEEARKKLETAVESEESQLKREMTRFEEAIKSSELALNAQKEVLADQQKKCESLLEYFKDLLSGTTTTITAEIDLTERIIDLHRIKLAKAAKQLDEAQAARRQAVADHSEYNFNLD